MKVLNLTNQEDSDIKYGISIFPDKLPDVSIGPVPPAEEVTIMTRLSPIDLLILLEATQVLRRNGVKHIHLYVPYLMGSRMDRVIHKNRPFTLKIVADILKLQRYASIITCDVHSNVTAGLFDGETYFEDNGCPPLYEAVINGVNTMPYIVVAPDKGAKDRTKLFADRLGYGGMIAQAEKERNANGEVVNVYITNPNVFHNTPRIIPLVVDDICDGGRTFELLAMNLRNYTNASPILVVTHGIFSHGYETILNYYSQVYTTNSQHDVAADLRRKYPSPNIAHKDRIQRVVVTDVYKKDILNVIRTSSNPK